MAASGSGTTESGGMMRCREEREERYENGLHPGHIPFTYIRYTECRGGVNRTGNIVISFFALERLRCQ